MSLRIIQRDIPLTPRPRGFHLLTDEIMNHMPDLAEIKKGIAHIFIRHTSASLSVNERADPDVRHDMETHFNIMVPEDADYYRHTDEGPDDMTSHIKATLIGSSVTIPVTNGRFNLGTWQGIYLCEHRNHGGIRRLTVTVIGE